MKVLQVLQTLLKTMLQVSDQPLIVDILIILCFSSLDPPGMSNISTETGKN